MPGLDETGPTGKGKQTGRGMGKCSQNDSDMKNFAGRRPRGIKRGAGKRNWNKE